jgi:hypothetical protein
VQAFGVPRSFVRTGEVREISGPQNNDILKKAAVILGTKPQSFASR